MHNEYAIAFTSLAKEEKIESVIKDEILAIKEIFNDELIKFFNVPSIALKDKIYLIDKALKEANKYTLNFLKVLLENNRINEVNVILDDVITLLNQALNVSTVYAYSHMQLDKTTTDKLTKTLSNKYNTQIELVNIVDESLGGSIKLMMNGNVIDDTIKTRLQEIKSSLI